MQAIDRILLGLYRFRPVLDDDLPLDTGQLAWLLDNGVKNWISSDGIKRYEYPAMEEKNETSYLDRPLRDKARVIKALSILTAKKQVSFVSPTGFNSTFRIKLLSDGLLRAEKLDSYFGKLELLYTDNKNGIIGLLLTAIISAIVSLLTTILSK
jgi:hypothetical protein